MAKSKVYFTKDISPNGLIKVFEALKRDLKGNVAVKISTGEPGGHNFLNPKLIEPLVSHLNGTIVECCTAYGGKRQDPKDHWQTIKDHGFFDIAPCDIMDEFGEKSIPIKNGFHLKEDIVGEHIDNYDSFLLLSHFKGHAMGGFGGAVKNISIGIASATGKCWIHTAGKVKKDLWQNLPKQDYFLESMAEAAKAVLGAGSYRTYCGGASSVSDRLAGKFRAWTWGAHWPGCGGDHLAAGRRCGGADVFALHKLRQDGGPIHLEAGKDLLLSLLWQALPV